MTADRNRWQENNRSLLLLLDTLDGTCFIKNKDGIYQYINKAFETQFSVKREEVIGKDDVFVFGPEIATALQENDQRIMASKIPESVEEAGYLPGGKFVFYLTNKTPIFDENGEVSGICGVGVDIAYQKEIEEQLRLSEEKYKVLVEQSRDMVYSIGIDGVFTYVNPQVAQFGYTPEEWIGQHVLQFVLPELIEEIGRQFQTRVETGDSTPAQLQWLRKDGSYCWVEVSARTVYDDSGRPINRVGIMRDISQQLEMEQKLRQSEEKYRVLIEHSHDVVFAVGIDGRITYIDLQMAQYGYTVEDVVGKSVFEFIAPEQREEIRHIFQELVISGNSTPVRFQWLRKDGSRSWVEVVANTVYDASGNPLERIGIMRNITLQMEMENKLRKSEEKYRNLVEQISEVIYSVNLDGDITYISPAIEAFLGYSPAEIVGQPITQFVVSEEVSRLDDSFQRLSSGEVLGANEYLTATKAGDMRWIQTSSRPVLEGDQVVGVQGVMIDITERKRAERQREEAVTSAERERIARDLHDAVTQSVFMAASIAETLPQVWESKPDEARRGLDELRRLTVGALAEMRNMLIELHPTALTDRTLGVLLKQLCDGLMARTQMLVTISVAGDCHLPDEIQIALYRIAQEALNNIVKHAHARRAIVRLDCTPKQAQLSIEDNGRGFDPRAIGSDHMGISNMNERAQAIGAEFRLDSEPGQGTKIAVVWRKRD